MMNLSLLQIEGTAQQNGLSLLRLEKNKQKKPTGLISSIEDLILSIVTQDVGLSTSCLFIQKILKLLSHRDVVELQYFCQFKYHALEWLAVKQLSNEGTLRLSDVRDYLIGQVRFNDSDREFIQQRHGIKVPKYITFGDIDAYQVPPTQKLFQETWDRVGANPKLLHPHQKKYFDIFQKVEGVEQTEITDLLTWQLQHLFITESTSMIGVPMSIIEGYKKGVFLTPLNTLTFVVSGCENGLKSSAAKQSHKLYLEAANGNKFTNNDDFDEDDEFDWFGLDIDEDPENEHDWKNWKSPVNDWDAPGILEIIRLQALNTTLEDAKEQFYSPQQQIIRYAQWLIEVAEDVPKNENGTNFSQEEWVEHFLSVAYQNKYLRNLHQDSLTQRPLVDALQHVADYRRLAAIKACGIESGQISLIPDLDYGWKYLVNLGWTRLLLSLVKASKSVKARCRDKESKAFEQLYSLDNIVIVEPNDRVLPHQRYQFYGGKTGVDDINCLEFTPIVQSNKLIKLRSKLMKSNTLSDLETTAKTTKVVGDNMNINKKALRYDSIKAQYFKTWIADNGIKYTDTRFLREEEIWYGYNKQEWLWEPLTDLDMRGIVHQFIVWYHQELLAEDQPQFNHPSINSLIRFLESQEIISIAQRFDNLLMADGRVLTCGKNPKIIELDEETRKHQFFTSKTAYSTIDLEPSESQQLTLKELCPNLHTLFDGLANNSHEYQYLQAFCYGIIARKAHLQRHLALVGYGGAGKSTFARICEMLAGEGASVSTSIQRIETNNFATSQLIGKTLVVLPDEAPHMGSVSVLKSLTSYPEKLVIEKKGHQPINAAINAMVLLCANSTPIMDSFSAITRRFMSIDCQKVPKTVDPDLLDKCLNELDFFVPYLLEKGENWATRILTQKSTDSDVNLRLEADSVYGFLTQVLVPTETEQILEIGSNHKIFELKKLYPAYRAYCAGLATKSHVNVNHFTRRIKELIHVARKQFDKLVYDPTIKALRGNWMVDIKSPLLGAV